MLRYAAVLVILALWLAPASAQNLYKADAGPLGVTEREATWRDDARSRDVPVKIYLPGTGKEPAAAPPAAPRGEGEAGEPGVSRAPLLVFSHGMGGTRNGYAYLGRHLASHGYVVIHPQHAGSDAAGVARQARDRVLPRRGGAREGGDGERGGDQERGAEQRRGQRDNLILENVNDRDNLRNRPLDITFVIDHAMKDAELGPRIDAERIAVGGHSFGSYTALAVGGMKVVVPPHPDTDGPPVETSFRDPRVKALVAMSPQGSGVMGVRPGAWGSLAAPTLFLTGTRDYGQGQRSAAWRREAFEGARGVEAWLIVLTDGTHMTFGRGAVLGGTRHEAHVRWVLASTTAFLDAHLREDRAGAAWLAGLKEAMGGEGTVEHRVPAPAAAPGGG